MYIHVQVCIYVCICLCVNVCVHVHMYVCVPESVYVCVQGCNIAPVTLAAWGVGGEKVGSKPSYTSKSAPSPMVLASCGNPHVRVLRDRRCGFAALQSELQTGGGSEAKVLGCWIWLLTSGPYYLPSCSRTPPQPRDMPCFPSLVLPIPFT